MYFAMSRLKVFSEKESEFEIVWKNRAKDIDGVKGFKKQKLLGR